MAIATRNRISIEFDATQGFESDDIERLLSMLKEASEPVSLTLRSAHLLTAKAFSVLTQFLVSEQREVALSFVESDETRIFPPLLEMAQ